MPGEGASSLPTPGHAGLEGAAGFSPLVKSCRLEAVQEKMVEFSLSGMPYAGLEGTVYCWLP